MNASELYEAFRSDVVDTARPFLWSDDEVFRYMDAAYRMFVRLTGGIADFTTDDVVKISLEVGTDVYDAHPTILRIMSAMLLSTGKEITVINSTDLPRLYQGTYDYGMFRTLSMTNEPGEPRWLVQGMERDKVKIIQIPEAVDDIMLIVYRMPLTHVVDDQHELDEVDEQHHIYLLDWMKHLAYKKQDAETFDKTKADQAALDFRNYCNLSKAEWERYKHKTRVVSYGGI